MEDDFSPDEYSKRMQELFNEEFYAQGEEDDTKPVFSDSDGDLLDEDAGEFGKCGHGDSAR